MYRKSQIPSTKLSPFGACGDVGRAHENKSQILISKIKTNFSLKGKKRKLYQRNKGNAMEK
jgi:hypothetical protein